MLGGNNCARRQAKVSRLLSNPSRQSRSYRSISRGILCSLPCRDSGHMLRKQDVRLIGCPRLPRRHHGCVVRDLHWIGFMFNCNDPRTSLGISRQNQKSKTASGSQERMENGETMENTRRQYYASYYGFHRSVNKFLEMKITRPPTPPQIFRKI